VIHLEDTQLLVRVTMGKGVEACTKKNVLRNALRDGAGERVFGVAAAGDKERTKANREGAVGTHGSATKFFGVGLAKNGYGNGVVEDERSRVIELVRGATQGHTKSSSGGARFFHERGVRLFGYLIRRLFPEVGRSSR
jgi:hypothetical protein